ncbi:MAG: DUF3365 domain-containing protein [Gammaproteobacteria bacterium]|nr:DUF3365 domain-containing protein [Gammaproteobacteria bacterium]
MRYETKKVNVFVAAALSLCSFLPASAMADENTAQSLTELLIAARNVVSTNRKLVNNPQSSGKNVDKLMEEVKKQYSVRAKKKLDESNEGVKYFLHSIKTVLTDAVAGKYTKTWPAEPYANKFLPARFASLTAAKFSEVAWEKYSMKLTTLDKCLVNKSNKADDWERQAIENKLIQQKGPAGTAVFGTTDLEGEKVFRYIAPEFYSKSCLKCHGEGNGKNIHAGKLEGKENEFGGAISIIIFW